VQRRLFDPFFTTKGVQGTGLGMSVAYGITRRHGATIEVESELRKGTEFRLEFPALRDEEVEPMHQPKSEAPLEGDERVLVVDDQGDIIDLLEDVLGSAGYTVVKASRQRSLAELQAGPFDLHHRPRNAGMSGWEVVREARRIRPEIRTLLLTGWAATLDPEEIKRNGVDQTLKKPFEMDEILQTVGTSSARRGCGGSRSGAGPLRSGCRSTSGPLGWIVHRTILPAASPRRVALRLASRSPPLPPGLRAVGVPAPSALRGPRTVQRGVPGSATDPTGTSP
jgi:CheY-like chemotaxis protein